MALILITSTIPYFHILLRRFTLLHSVGNTDLCMDGGGGSTYYDTSHIYNILNPCDYYNNWQQWQLHNPTMYNNNLGYCFSQGVNGQLDSSSNICSTDNTQRYSLGCRAGQTPTYFMGDDNVKTASGCALCSPGKTYLCKFYIATFKYPCIP